MLYTRNLITGNESVQNYNNSVRQINVSNKENERMLTNLYNQYKRQNDLIKQAESTMLNQVTNLLNTNVYINKLIDALRS